MIIYIYIPLAQWNVCWLSNWYPRGLQKSLNGDWQTDFPYGDGLLRGCFAAKIWQRHIIKQIVQVCTTFRSIFVYYVVCIFLTDSSSLFLFDNRLARHWNICFARNNQNGLHIQFSPLVFARPISFHVSTSRGLFSGSGQRKYPRPQFWIKN